MAGAVSSLEDRVATLEAIVNLLADRLLVRGDITVNDARAAYGLPALRETGVIAGTGSAAAKPGETPGGA